MIFLVNPQQRQDEFLIEQIRRTLIKIAGFANRGQIKVKGEPRLNVSHQEIKDICRLLKKSAKKYVELRDQAPFTTSDIRHYLPIDFVNDAESAFRSDTHFAKIPHPWDAMSALCKAYGLDDRAEAFKLEYIFAFFLSAQSRKEFPNLYVLNGQRHPKDLLDQLDLLDTKSFTPDQLYQLEMTSDGLKLWNERIKQLPPMKRLPSR